jgi:hypothetical protein
MIVPLLIGTLLHATAAAAPVEPIANAGDVPALSKLLERTGWAPTPELTGNIQIGDVFASTPQGQQWQAEGCLSAKPRSAPYTEVEVSTQLQLGVSVRAGVARAGADTSLSKIVRFGAPEHHSLPGLGLALTDECKTLLTAQADLGRDLRNWYIVKEVMLAEISEQTCGEVDASGRFMAFSGGTELAQSCAQSSQGKVAVAWRTLPLPEVDPSLARAAIAAPAITAPAVTEQSRPVAEAQPTGAQLASSAEPMGATPTGATGAPSSVDASSTSANTTEAAAKVKQVNGVPFRTDGYYQCLVPILGTAVLVQPVGLIVGEAGHWWMYFALTGRGLDRSYWGNRAEIDKNAGLTFARATTPLISISMPGALVEVKDLSRDEMLVNFWWRGANLLNGVGAEEMTCYFREVV